MFAAALSKIAPYFAKPAMKAAGAKWKEILLGVLLAIMIYQNMSNSRWVFWADTIPYLRTELAILETEIEIINQANETLVADIEQRNAEIERWSNVTMQLEANTSMLQAEISKIELKANSRIRTVETQVIPQECSGAMNYLFDSIPELDYKLITDEDDE